jgi:hypothetical protein
MCADDVMTGILKQFVARFGMSLASLDLTLDLRYEA